MVNSIPTPELARQLVRLAAVAQKWQEQVVACLHSDHLAIVELRIRVERGRLHRINAGLDEEQPLEMDLPPYRRAGPPQNLREQRDELDGKAKRFIELVHATMREKRTGSYVLRAKAEGGRVFRVNWKVDEEDALEMGQGQG